MDTSPALVLVVDDNEANRFAKSQILGRAGFAVVQAGTGREALEAARRDPIDIVLLDVNLPDMSGLDVCERLKGDRTLAAIQVLQISATAISDADKVSGLTRGADAYLQEPSSPEVLLATLRALLRVRRADRALMQALDREREARDIAELANRAKDDFLATLSHELRTPLNAILGWVSQLRDGSMDETRRARALEGIERSARHQWRLVSQLLDVASIRARKLQLEKSIVDLHAIATTAADLVVPAAAERSVDVQVSAQPVRLMADAARLQQVITNLLTNAVQFTGERGLVRLTIRGEADDAVIEVEDTGMGIDPTLLPFVFDEFRQGDADRSGHGGLGLGLAITKHIVEMHGGRITAESEGVGRGARFVARIPLAADDADHALPISTPAANTSAPPRTT